jgi:FAD/FMN-containing dehydrogenase
VAFHKKQGALQPGLFLTVHVFGNNDVHDEFMQRYLSALQNIAKGGTVKSIDRLDVLAFHRKLGGVKSNDDLARGQHGHDLHKMWKGYSAVSSRCVSADAFRALAESILVSQPVYRRYAELKPLGGAILRHSKTDTAFWHRDALWWVLSNHFYEETDPKETILKQSKSNHENFSRRMKDSFGGMYAGYIDTGNSTGKDLETYYGENAERITQIKRERDPHNMFRHFLPNTPELSV